MTTLTTEQARVMREMQRNPDSPHTAKTLRTKISVLEALYEDSYVSLTQTTGNYILWNLTDKGRELRLGG